MKMTDFSSLAPQGVAWVELATGPIPDGSDHGLLGLYMYDRNSQRLPIGQTILEELLSMEDPTELSQPALGVFNLAMTIPQGLYACSTLTSTRFTIGALTGEDHDLTFEYDPDLPDFKQYLSLPSADMPGVIPTVSSLSVLARAGLLSNPDTPAQVLNALAASAQTDLVIIAQHPNADAQTLQILIDTGSWSTDNVIATHPRVTPEQLDVIARRIQPDLDPHFFTLLVLTQNPRTSAETLTYLHQTHPGRWEQGLALHANTPTAILRTLSHSQDAGVRLKAALNTCLPSSDLRRLAQDADSRVQRAAVHTLEQLAPFLEHGFN